MTRTQLRQALHLIGATSLTIAAFIGGAVNETTEKKTTRETISTTETAPLAPPKPEQSNKSKTPNSLDVFLVSRVIDGDTIDVLMNNKKTRVRLIGINTPEAVDPNRPVQCFGKEASNNLHTLLDGRSVALVQDKAAGDTDKFGRLLRYVERVNTETGGHIDMNAEQISSGHAFEYTYKKATYERQAIYKDLEQKAKLNSRGLWSTSTCGGQL